MPLHETLVHGRDKIIHRILGTNPDFTLNSRRCSDKGISGRKTLAGEIKDLLNQIKMVSISENGKVDYQKLAQDPLYQSYKDLTGKLVDFDLLSLKSTEEKTAFWINLYNALVIDAVIQENVQKSITESKLGIMAFFERAAYCVNNLRFSLTDIEHGVLRGNRGFPFFPGQHFAPTDPRLEAVINPVDPRVHFALNCASNSCPPISIYTPEGLDLQLDLAARNFINQELFPNLDQKTLSTSRIFQWYQVDFGGRKGILSFLVNYIQDPQVQSWLIENHPAIRVKYFPYDWGLNKTNT